MADVEPLQHRLYNRRCLRITEFMFKTSASAVVGLGIASCFWSLALFEPSSGSPYNGGWGLYALAACGFAAAIISAIGIGAAAWRSLRTLSVHVVLLALLFSAQVCLSVAVAIQLRELHATPLHADSPHPRVSGVPESTDSKLGGGGVLIRCGTGMAGEVAPGGPGDLSEQLPTLGDPASTSSAVLMQLLDTSPITLPHQDLLITEAMAMVLTGLELLTLGLGCLLQSSYTQIEEAIEDAMDSEAPSAPLLRHAYMSQQRPVPVVPGDEASEWRARMQERYGLDTRAFSYQPGASRAPEAAPQLVPYTRAPRQRERRGCSLM